MDSQTVKQPETEIKPSHTPGPWHVESAGRKSLRESTSHVFARNPKGAVEDDDIITIADYIDNAANAHLIAAAPDLYEACKALVGGRFIGDVSGVNTFTTAWESILAAIAKAEGQS